MAFILLNEELTLNLIFSFVFLYLFEDQWIPKRGKGNKTEHITNRRLTGQTYKHARVTSFEEAPCQNNIPTMMHLLSPMRKEFSKRPSGRVDISFTNDFKKVLLLFSTHPFFCFLASISLN